MGDFEADYVRVQPRGHQDLRETLLPSPSARVVLWVFDSGDGRTSPFLGASALLLRAKKLQPLSPFASMGHGHNQLASRSVLSVLVSFWRPLALFFGILCDTNFGKNILNFALFQYGSLLPT